MCLIVISKPIVLLPSLLNLVIFFYLRRYYIASSRPVKRLEGVAKSPIFTHLSVSLQGLTTIRYNIALVRNPMPCTLR